MSSVSLVLVQFRQYTGNTVCCFQLYVVGICNFYQTSQTRYLQFYSLRQLLYINIHVYIISYLKLTVIGVMKRNITIYSFIQLINIFRLT